MADTKNKGSHLPQVGRHKLPWQEVYDTCRHNAPPGDHRPNIASALSTIIHKKYPIILPEYNPYIMQPLPQTDARASADSCTFARVLSQGEYLLSVVGCAWGIPPAAESGIDDFFRKMVRKNWEVRVHFVTERRNRAKKSVSWRRNHLVTQELALINGE